MKFRNLDYINIGELIRFKDELLNSERISVKEFHVITKYLDFIINEERD